MTLIPCDRNFNIRFKCVNFKALPDDCIASQLERNSVGLWAAHQQTGIVRMLTQSTLLCNQLENRKRKEK